MLQGAVGLAVNPAEETIRLGPLALRFLVTGEDTGGKFLRSVRAHRAGRPAPRGAGAQP